MQTTTSAAPAATTLRIASLVPSGTDLVAAFGLGNALVGVSHECDHTVAAGKPVLTRSNVPSAGTPEGSDPAVVDRAVSEALAAGDSLYVTDRERLAALQPSVVLSQDVCDVCAVSGPAARAAVPAGAELVMLTATSIAGLADDLRRVGTALGRPAAAEDLVADVTARLAEVSRRVAGAGRPRVIALEWGDPPFLGGHWVPELIEIAGGRHLCGDAGQPSRRTTWTEVARADPDVLVFLPCGYSLAAAEAEARQLLERSEVAALRAVREDRFWVTDATRLFSRCTTVVTEAAEVLAAILHPDVLPPPSASLARTVTAATIS